MITMPVRIVNRLKSNDSGVGDNRDAVDGGCHDDGDDVQARPPGRQP